MKIEKLKTFYDGYLNTDMGEKINEIISHLNSLPEDLEDKVAKLEWANLSYPEKQSRVANYGKDAMKPKPIPEDSKRLNHVDGCGCVNDPRCIKAEDREEKNFCCGRCRIKLTTMEVLHHKC